MVIAVIIQVEIHQGDITEMGVDGMRHFIGSKKTDFGLLKPLVAAREEWYPERIS
jgi:hypothetical protein